MKTIKVDVLIVGNMAASSYCSCAEPGNVMALGDAEIDANNPPKEFENHGIRYDISNSIIIKAPEDTDTVFVRSCVALSGKVLVATGYVSTHEVNTLKQL